MKKALTLLITASLALTLIGGCATNEKKETVVTPMSTDKFRTLNANRNNRDINVVCHNCNAQFKISKNAMKSGTAVRCPVCKHLYRM